jgi:uncharacterized protein YuzE
MSKPILNVTSERVDTLNLMYIRYTSKSPSVRQQDLDEHGSLVVDYAADGSIIGIEMISQCAENLELLARFAQEHDLSLDGLFSHAA